ncbi:MAG: hypothetical protein FJ202_10090 [Gemmatimonadetes bacterium]|nr:hypothetical protein [Gemmatimonadota bacterium]
MTEQQALIITEVPAPREQGWARVLFGVALFLILPVTPLLRVVLPIEQTALLLGPAIAACAVVGWIGGGRTSLAVVWTAVAAWSVWQLSGGGLFALLQGGWALLVAATFGVVLLAARDRTAEFLPSALKAVGIAAAVVLVLSVVVPGGPTRVADGIAAESGRRAEQSRAGWRTLTATAEWKEFATANPAADEMAKLVDTQLAQLPVTARTLFPALAALEALAALALAWALYHRIGRARIGRPLGALKEFRFSDHFVWGVVGGLGLLLIPGAALVRAIGANMLLSAGALYTIRGVGVFLWMISPGRVATAFLVVLALLFWNVLGVMALGLGVGDTWLDWRRRARPNNT